MFFLFPFPSAILSGSLSYTLFSFFFLPFAAHMNGAIFNLLLSFWVLFKYAVSTASVL
jgi:hypothetical protein